MAKIEHDIKGKEVKWVEVDYNDSIVKIFFTDFTFIMLENIKIKEID